MSTAYSPADQRLILSDVDWSTYERLLHDLDGRHLRFNFDQGQLEIMTVSAEHERVKKLLARLLEVLTEVLNIPILGLGNTTFRREDSSRGLEPDECWYIAHEPQMRERDTIDLTIDPPPDLVIEVEISRSVVDRMEIYGALGVPEVWRCDGRSLTVEVLADEGTYIESEHSPTFPNVPLAGFVEHLNRRGRIDETSIIRSFREWARTLA
ncbi:MAG TPA: Uma2 family endonuclease [Planctomycetaceae bacterium]|nr:Uma2 family endonuclease [Planctomycetaceae bacterium]